MQQTEWLIIFLVFISTVLISLRNYYQKEFYFFLRAPFSFKVFNEYIYELNQRLGFFSYVVYFTSLSLFVTIIYFLADYFNLNFFISDSTVGLVYMFLGAVLVIAAKNILLRIVQLVYRFDEIINVHILLTYLFNSFSGIIIFPFLIMIVYLDANLVNFSLVALFSIISLLYVLRLVFLVKILFRSGLSILSILLYLCALEIAPLLVLLNVVKLLVN